MNWSRTKTWLIVLFIGINLFLLFTIAKENIAQSTISEKMVADTVAILQRNSITVDPKIIPRKMPILSAMEVVNTMTSADEIADALLGGDATYDREDNCYLHGTAMVEVGGDSVRYTNTTPTHANAYQDEQSAIQFAKGFLTDAGYNMAKAEAQILRYSDHEAHILLTQKMDSYPLMDSQFSIRVTSKGVAGLEGCWFYMAEDQSGASGARGRVKEITSVLIDFMNDPNRSGSSSTITKITLGYTTGDKMTYHKSVSAMPSWRITTADGKEYYYDASSI